MSFGDRLAVIGVILALLGIGIPILWSTQKWIGWICTGLAVLLAIGWMSFEITHRRAAHYLGISATANMGNIRNGTMVSGITWNSIFSSLTIQLENSTEQDYENLDIALRPDQPIAGIGQLTSIPNVSFLMNPPINVQAAKGLGTVIAYNGGYRVICPKLPKRSPLQIILAIARPTGKKGMELSLSDGRIYWATYHGDGVTNFADYFEPKVFSKSVEVKGDYVVSGAKEDLSTHVNVDSSALGGT